ncbi:MAG: hypothetical protein AB7D57_14375 [Desulfovibrionaceae bacterium]
MNAEFPPIPPLPSPPAPPVVPARTGAAVSPWIRCPALILRLGILACLGWETARFGLKMLIALLFTCFALCDPESPYINWAWLRGGFVLLAAFATLLGGLLLGWAVGGVRGWQRWLYAFLALGCGAPFTQFLPDLRWADLAYFSYYELVLLPVASHALILLFLLIRPLHPLLFGWPPPEEASFRFE